MPWRTAPREVVSLLANPRGWWASALLAVLAAALRVPALSRPHEFVFDETYYAKDAFSLLRFGYERAFVDDANQLLLAGNTGVFQEAPEFVVHPPLGKWVIALGEALFGMNPFGWRIVMCVLGIIAVVLVHRIALRLTGNVVTAALAGLFMAIDGLAIVLSRTALLDQTLTFCIIVTFQALVLDRDHYRHTLALRTYERAPRWRSLRPWRLLAILALTAGCATKWSAVWFGIGFAVLAWRWDMQARRLSGLRQRYWLADATWVLASMAIVTSGYVLSWLGWLRSTDGWGRSATSGLTWLPQPLQALLAYHSNALHFHTSLTSSHPYKAAPIGWPLMVRPTSFSYSSFAAGEGGCESAKCASEVLAMGNVVLWWLGSITVVVMLSALLLRALRVRWEFRGRSVTPGSRLDTDIIAGPLVGFAAGWLPWLYFHERTTFTFYAVVMAPFLFILLAQGIMLFATTPASVSLPARIPEPEPDDVLPGLLAERALLDVTPSPAGEPLPEPLTRTVTTDVLHERRFPLAVFAVALAVGFTGFYYPIWTGAMLSQSQWQLRMWLDNWV